MIPRNGDEEPYMLRVAFDYADHILRQLTRLADALQKKDRREDLDLDHILRQLTRLADALQKIAAKT